MQTYLAGVLRGKSADYIEIRVEDAFGTTISYQGATLETLAPAISFGGCVRALVNGGWGFVSFNNLDALERSVNAAIAQARIIASLKSTPLRLADVPTVVDRVPLKVGRDPRDIPLPQKKALLDAYNDQVLSYGRGVSSSKITYFDKYTHLWFANSEGTYIEQEKVDVSGSIRAIATRGGDTQYSFATFGGSQGWDAALGHEAKISEACQIASDLLDAPSVNGGAYTVILDPPLAAVLVHESFGHQSEADTICENPDFSTALQLGRMFGPTDLNIYDTGLETGSRGHLVYDDEGVKTEKTDLIREGLLVGRLHSRETAAKMGERPTGNARAISYEYAPIVRMRTTAIGPGNASFEDMLKGVKLGVYAKDTKGGEGGRMFTFSADHCYMIRDGKLAELVRGVNLSGNLFQTLKDIDMIGSDSQRNEYGGGCGKAGQAPLATAELVPHIRVQNVVVGGGS